MASSEADPSLLSSEGDKVPVETAIPMNLKNCTIESQAVYGMKQISPNLIIRKWDNSLFENSKDPFVAQG